jgi:hypothetical protein
MNCVRCAVIHAQDSSRVGVVLGPPPGSKTLECRQVPILREQHEDLIEYLFRPVRHPILASCPVQSSSVAERFNGPASLFGEGTVALV